MSKTSSAVKRRYNEKNYKSVQVYLDKDLVDAFKAKCKTAGSSQSSVIREAIENFMKK